MAFSASLVRVPAAGPRRLAACSNALWALLLIGLAAYVLHVGTNLGGDGVDRFFNAWVYDSLMVGAGLSIVLSGLRDRKGRTVWLVLGAGVLAWAAGEIYFSLELSGQSTLKRTCHLRVGRAVRGKPPAPGCLPSRAPLHRLAELAEGLIR